MASLIAGLPSLEYLELVELEYGSEEWCQGDVTFDELKKLRLVDLDISRWDASEDSFPLLEMLVICRCDKLKEIPLSFADIQTLKCIKLIDCKTKSLKASAVKIKEEVEEIQGCDRINLMVRDTWLGENEVVGFDREAKILIRRLDEGTNDLDVISVVGMCGQGKTTLALKIYEDPKISFFKRIWVYVGRPDNPKEVLLRILGWFTEVSHEYEQMSLTELLEKIHEFISKGGKFLIVLDDVWTEHVVDSVMNVFPKDSKGHRIMITTRAMDVVSNADAYPHRLKFLKVEECFQLLVNKVFHSNGRRCPDELVAHGKIIAKQCVGVPLAVLLIAGALRGCTSESEWKMVEDNIEQYRGSQDDYDIYSKFVEISYGYLPEDMKACFLYCGAFPPSFKIPAWKLIRLWISEGLINCKLDASPENIAEQYLNELVNRNLVMVTRKRADGQVKTCQLHDLLHDFCAVEAKEGGHYEKVHGTQYEFDIPDLGTTHRLCIQLSPLEAFISRIPSSEQVRSFLCFSTKLERFKELRFLHKAFPLVRVLDVESIQFTSREFQEQYHLRYIAISGNYTTLPEFFGMFWNLQTLILNTTNSSIEIKANIWNLLRLRHLHTNVPATLLSPATQSASSCLQTLSKVAPESCRIDVLARACNLRKVSLQGKMAGFFETKGEFNNFEKLKCLEDLKLLNPYYNSKVLKLPPAFLGFLHKLKKLTLSNTGFDWSDANRLGQLESLEVLKLKENAFIGTTWDSEGFGQLKVLRIQWADLKTWKASNSFVFQRLQSVVLISCHNLEAMPLELATLSSLQEITLVNTKKAISSAIAIQGKKKKMQEQTWKTEESKSGTESQSYKFKLSIIPPPPPPQLTSMRHSEVEKGFDYDLWRAPITKN